MKDYCKLYPQKQISLECYDVVYKPDFGTLGELQERFGNDIDLMVNKPQYRDLINANMQEIPTVSQFEGLDLTDEQKLEVLPSREFDVNELAEYARGQGSDFVRQLKDKSA